MDLSKAFDTIDHVLLLSKLSFYGFSPSAILLIKSYLLNRFSITTFDGARSRPEPLKVGVPQGSVLGPLLFIIFINDMCHLNLKSFLDLFADDSTASGSSDNIKCLIESLSDDLNIISDWLLHNRLVINWPKTHAILFNFVKIKSNPLFINSHDLNLSLGTVSIPFVDQTKILGVVLDDKLRFNHHIISLCKRVNSKVHMLSRNLYLFSIDFRSILFKLFIQPLFDYCSSLFMHLDNKIDQNRLTSVFSKSIKKLLNINLFNLTPNIQLILLSNFNILPLIFRYFQRLSFFIHSLFKFNTKSSLVSSIFIFNNRNNLIHQSFQTLKKKYSFSIVSSKLLSIFIYSRLGLSKISFKKYFNSNLIKLFNLCNHVWDLDIFY